MRINALNVARNPFQGQAKKVLCVCSAGVLRSPTAAIVLQREYGYNTRAAGADEEFALIPVTDVLIHWADEIVFMEQHHKSSVGYDFDLSRKDTVVLGIPDCYEYMSEELQSLIKYSYESQRHIVND